MLFKIETFDFPVVLVVGDTLVKTDNIYNKTDNCNVLEYASKNINKEYNPAILRFCNDKDLEAFSEFIQEKNSKYNMYKSLYNLLASNSYIVEESLEVNREKEEIFKIQIVLNNINLGTHYIDKNNSVFYTILMYQKYHSFHDIQYTFIGDKLHWDIAGFKNTINLFAKNDKRILHFANSIIDFKIYEKDIYTCKPDLPLFFKDDNGKFLYYAGTFSRNDNCESEYESLVMDNIYNIDNFNICFIDYNSLFTFTQYARYSNNKKILESVKKAFCEGRASMLKESIIKYQDKINELLDLKEERKAINLGKILSKREYNKKDDIKNIKKRIALIRFPVSEYKNKEKKKDNYYNGFRDIVSNNDTLSLSSKLLLGIVIDYSQYNNFTIDETVLSIKQTIDYLNRKDKK